MNAVESALYSAAELQLLRANPQGAVAALQKVLAAEPREELKNLTHLNLGEIYRRHARDAANATKQYLLVAGPDRHRARHYLLILLADAGKAADAAAIVEDLVKASKEKGEKLAILHSLAAFYKQCKMPDQALAVYERIGTEFTAKDVEQMRQAAVREVEAALRKIVELRHNDRGDDAERLEQQVHARARELLLARRWDELKAFQEAADKGFARLEEALKEREREGEQPPPKGKEGEF
jgi:hypothetical protein